MIFLQISLSGILNNSLSQIVKFFCLFLKFVNISIFNIFKIDMILVKSMGNQVFLAFL